MMIAADTPITISRTPAITAPTTTVVADIEELVSGTVHGEVTGTTDDAKK